MNCSIEGCEGRVHARGLCGSHYSRLRLHGDPNIKKLPSLGETEAFLKKAIDYDGDDCLIWPFARDSAGYPRIGRHGKVLGTHRIVCEGRNGPPPSPKHEAAHYCGNGHLGCVAGSHLRWATHKENHSDRKAHGTNNAGEKCGSAKLTDQAVTEIRDAYSLGETQRSIALRFDVTESTIRQVVKRTTWTHLP